MTDKIKVFERFIEWARTDDKMGDVYGFFKDMFDDADTYICLLKDAIEDNEPAEKIEAARRRAESSIDYAFDALDRVDPSSYHQVYDYRDAVFFLRFWNTNNPKFVQWSINDAELTFEDDDAAMDAMNMTADEILERADTELYTKSLYDSTPYLDYVCAINRELVLYLASSLRCSWDDEKKKQGIE